MLGLRVLTLQPVHLFVVVVVVHGGWGLQLLYATQLPAKAFSSEGEIQGGGDFNMAFKVECEIVTKSLNSKFQ